MITYAHVKQDPRPNDRQWWGYLHQNGTLQVKPWFGDVRDYTDDCEDNEFTPIVVPPFWASSQGHAAILMKTAIDNFRSGAV